MLSRRVQIPECQVGYVQVGVYLNEALKVLLRIRISSRGSRCIAKRSERKSVFRIDFQNLLVGCDGLFGMP
jgi:hypothetical protein